MPIDSYALVEQQDAVRAAGDRQIEAQLAARTWIVPEGTEPWQHLSDATKERVKALFAKWTLCRRGELGPPDRIQVMIDAQREMERENYARMVSLGIAPRGMDGRTPVSSRSGLPEWTRDVTSLFFHPESGDLCQPFGWPTGTGDRPPMWNGRPFTKPFELPATWDWSQADFDLARIVWRPGEHRWLPSPDAELPAP